MVWAYAKEHTRTEGFRCGSVNMVKEMFLKWLKTITPSMAAKYADHAKKVEDEYRKEEGHILPFIELEGNEDLENDYNEEDIAIQNLLIRMLEEEN